MVDIWSDFSSAVKTIVTAREDFTADFHIDLVSPDDALPYAVLLEGGIENWKTFSVSTAGEVISFRVLLTNNVRGGGVSVLKQQTTEVVKALHLQDFSGDDFTLEYCKRTSWVQPFKVDEDTLRWHQYVDFEARLTYNEDSDFFKNL